MNIDLGSFAYGSTLEKGVGTPAWGTSLGQSRPEYYITREGSEEVVMGMVYCSVPLDKVSLPLGRGGKVCNCLEAETIQLSSVFTKVFVNGKPIQYPFIMVLQKEDSDSHSGRRGIKYTDKAIYEYQDGRFYSNSDFVKHVYQEFELSEDACWFVYDISVKNYDELHLKAIFVNKDDSEEYLDSHSRSEEWTTLIEEAGDEYNVRYISAKVTTPETISPEFRPYITAIKSKPFLLLAGISGTGKSRIVRELARACWNQDDSEYKAQKPRNFEMVQVKPNWHDSSELIGYVSRVSGKPIYVAGDFLKFIARAWVEPEIPYFLCLDEMNLAPVEQYFAEYLSVIESRKLQDDGYTVSTDPIINASYTNEYDENDNLIPQEWYSDLIKELLADCPADCSFALTKQFEREGITIPQNLIVVGTVNMDETTFSFSRKVLDRAMTIEMNEVNLRGGLSSRHDNIGKLSSAELIGTAVEGVDIYEQFKNVCDIAITYLEKVNSELERTPFKIAYRTRNEFLLYVVNNLPYNKLPDGEEDMEEYVIARALDEITNMKILSRIEGDETKVSNEFLESLEGTIKKSLEEIFDGPFAKEDSDEAYKSISLAKLDEMKTRLKSSGYTSFWS